MKIIQKTLNYLRILTSVDRIEDLLDVSTEQRLLKRTFRYADLREDKVCLYKIVEFFTNTTYKPTVRSKPRSVRIVKFENVTAPRSGLSGTDRSFFIKNQKKIETDERTLELLLKWASETSL